MQLDTAPYPPETLAKILVELKAIRSLIVEQPSHTNPTKALVADAIRIANEQLLDRIKRGGVL